MDFSSLILQRHTTLHDHYLAGIWKTVPQDLMRPRPHPRVNSIAWTIWHLLRVEDSGLNRFVAGRPQVLDEAQWMERMNAPWRHHGGGVGFAEVEELSRRIDLGALQEYGHAVAGRTQSILGQFDSLDLDSTLDADTLRTILVDEGLAFTDAEGLVEWYTGWTRGRCLMSFGLTHPFEHVGEIGALASLLGVVFE
jgi:hypothetical protein